MKEIITIKTGTGTNQKTNQKFTTYKYNLKGQAVDLKFRRASNNTQVIPENAIVKVVVEDLQADSRAFYPCYWATFIELAPKAEPEMSQQDVNA